MKHKYIFYFYPNFNDVNGSYRPGLFMVFERVSDGKSYLNKIYPTKAPYLLKRGLFYDYHKFY